MITTVNFRHSKMTVLLSLNAAAILIAGVLIAGAILLKGGMDFRVVGERTDENGIAVETPELIDVEHTPNVELSSLGQEYITSVRPLSTVDSMPVADGELWSEDSITIYESANMDICIGGDLTGLGEMYWQTSNPEVISGFFSGARTWLGYSSDACRFPIITGTGTTTITAGTYDGTRRDSIEVTVVEVPVTKWEREVLALVNQERVRNGLEKLTWSDTCADAAKTRAKELTELYSHTRPNGSSWDTACEAPSGGGTFVEGENLVVGNSAVSPETTVAAWMNSEKHRENILNPNYTKMAVGLYFDSSSQYKTHWSQYFSNF